MEKTKSRGSADDASETFHVESVDPKLPESMKRLIADNTALIEANELLHETLDERDATIERLVTRIGWLQKRVHMLTSHLARKRQGK